jgi:HK97 family phage major capsid protein
MDKLFRFSVMPFMLAMVAGILSMPTNVYQICRRQVGTLELEPWLSRTRDVVRSVVAFAWFARLFRSRLAFACAAVLLALLVSDLSAAHAATHGVSMAIVIGAGTRRTNLKAEMNEATNKAKALMTAAEKENRELNAEERTQVQEHLTEARRLKASIEQIDGDEAIQKEINGLLAAGAAAAAGADDRGRQRILSLGQQLVAMDQLREAVKAGNHRQAGFSVSMDYDFGATTLDESSGSGGKLVLPDYQQGIVPLLFRQIRVTQLLAPGTTGSNTIEYMQETTFTNAAATRAEAAAAAESTLVFNRVAETVRSIAHFIPVTQEMMEDQDQTQSYVDGRLRLGLDLAEEDQLLNGDGTGTNLTGLMNRSSLATSQARGSDTNADAIFKQITNIMTTAFVLPDGVIIHPNNWQTIVLSKDGNGQYYGAGPFNPNQTPILWGLPASVTPVQTANTAMVGAFRQCAQRFVRRGGTVTATNSHSDFFTKRLVAIMAEMREALAVYRPGGIGKVTGLN